MHFSKSISAPMNRPTSASRQSLRKPHTYKPLSSILPIVYLGFIGICLMSIRAAAAADIETAKVSDIVTPICKLWRLDMADPNWKNLVSRKTDNGTSLSTGSAYLVYNAKGATSESLQKVAILIRDAFRKNFGVETQLSGSEGAGGVQSKASSPAANDEYTNATFTVCAEKEIVTFEVRVIPLQSDLVGVLLSFSHVSEG